MPTTRELALMAFLSGALVLICRQAFATNPATRRWMIIQLSTIFCCVPVALSLLSASWSIGIAGAELWAPGRTLPDAILFAAPGIAILCMSARLSNILIDRLRIARLPMLNSRSAQSIAADLGQSIGWKRRIDIRTGRPPCSTSLGRATIVLPEHCVNWSPEAMRSVLAHEIVHIRRRDDLWLHHMRLVGDFFWFLPWLRLLPAQLEAAIEESCDDLASGTVRNTRAYLETLFEVAVSFRSPSAIAAGGSNLLRRFQRFHGVRDEQVDSRGLFWTCAAAVLLTTGLWTARLTEPAQQATDNTRIIALIKSRPDSPTMEVRLQPQPLKPPVLEAGTGPPPATSR